MVPRARDGVSGGDAPPEEHAQRRSAGDPTAGEQPVPGAAAATGNTEVADLMKMLLLQQAVSEKNRAEAEARQEARMTALEERQRAAESVTAAEKAARTLTDNGLTAVLGVAQSTEESVDMTGSCDEGGSPGARDRHQTTRGAGH